VFVDEDAKASKVVLCVAVCGAVFVAVFVETCVAVYVCVAVCVAVCLLTNMPKLATLFCALQGVLLQCVS